VAAAGAVGRRLSAGPHRTGLTEVRRHPRMAYSRLAMVRFRVPLGCDIEMQALDLWLISTVAGPRMALCKPPNGGPTSSYDLRESFECRSS
jgi:hypothetical protein